MKQRLIGAAVLVALAVIFLPMLLGRQEPAPVRGSEVSLEVPPAPQRSLQTREIPLTLPSPAAPAPAAVVDDPDRVVTVDADVIDRVDARPEDVAPPAAVQAPVQAPLPTPAPSAAAVSAAPTPTAPAAPATSTPPAASGAGAAAGPAGSRFVVNLGSYTNTANADALRGRLVAAGLPIYAEPITVDGRAATRLRAGPFATRGEAEAARLEARRVQADVPATVVALESSERSSGPAPARAAVAAGFAVQVGALKSEAEANALRDRLSGAGFPAWVERTRTDAGVLWRVRAGPELQRDRAERLRDDIRRRLQLDGLVVGHP